MKRFLSSLIAILVVTSSWYVAAFCPDPLNPPQMGAIDDSLLYRAESQVPLTAAGGPVVMVPDPELHNLVLGGGITLNDASPTFQIDGGLEVMRLATQTSSLGVMGERIPGDYPHQGGDITFIVPRNPEQLPGGSDHVEADDYYIVVAEAPAQDIPLSWHVASPMVARTSQFGSSVMPNCNCPAPTENPCAPQPDMPCLNPLECGLAAIDTEVHEVTVSTMPGLKHVAQTDACTGETRYVDPSGRVLPWMLGGGAYTNAVMEGTGLITQPNGAQRTPVLGGLGCKMCGQVLPEPGGTCNDFGFDPEDGVFDPPPQNACESTNPNVSVLCQQTVGGSLSPPMEAEMCPGFARKPERDFQPFGTCLPGEPMGLGVAMHSQSAMLDVESANRCGSQRPPLCQRILPGQTQPDICDPENKTADYYASQCTGAIGTGGGLPPGMECCSGVEACYCQVLGDGTKICTDCSGENGCQNYTERSFIDARRISNEDEDDDPEPDTEHGNAGNDEDDSGESTTENNEEVDTTDSTVVEDGDVTTHIIEVTKDHPECSTSGGCPGLAYGIKVDSSAKNNKPQSPSVEGTGSLTPENHTSRGHEKDATELGKGSGGNTGNSLPGKGGGKDKRLTRNDGDNRPPKPNPGNETGKEVEDAEEPTNRADPVSMQSGELLMSSTDLSFPGAVRELKFVRSYGSQRDSRGVLGSNWTHNFEVRLEQIRPTMAPAWAAPYCTDWYPHATCLIYHDGAGGKSLLTWDPVTEVYTPQAGEDFHATVNPNGGHLVRFPDGHVQRFHESGVMVSDRDRFGNGFDVEVEPTSLYMAYVRYCTIQADEELSSYILGTHSSNPAFDDRACQRLAYSFGERPLNELESQSGYDAAANNNNPLNTPYETTADPLEYEYDLGTVDATDIGTPTGLQDYQQKLELGGAYLRYLTRQGYSSVSVNGPTRFRITRVVDDHGRELKFEYYDNIGTPELYGLLREVEGPLGNKVTYQYSQPTELPAEMTEQFLTRVTRSHASLVHPSTSDAHWYTDPSRTHEFVYTYDTSSLSDLALDTARERYL